MKLELTDYIRICGESANRKGWYITWEELPAYLLATVAELTEGFDEGWRDDDKDKFAEELIDCLIRIFHICHDLSIPVEEILTRVIKENEKRPYKHGRVRI